MTNTRRIIACATVLTALIRAHAPNAVPAEEKIPPKLAVPVEPIGAIVDAFRSHRIVALGDNHGNEQGHKFRLSLIRDPRFAAAVDDIVVEFGSARYQDLMDRFVHGGDVPYESLRQVWQNTTQPEYEWDLPIYEEFFRAVRTVNSSLPRERQVRVLLGDPPMDWDSVHTIEDLRKQMGDRDAHAGEMIRSEVLARNRRALVIYGDEHLVRKNTVMGAADPWPRGLLPGWRRLLLPTCSQCTRIPAPIGVSCNPTWSHGPTRASQSSVEHCLGRLNSPPAHVGV